MSKMVYAGGYDVDKDRLTSVDDIKVVEKFEPGADVMPTIEDAIHFGAISMEQGMEDVFKKVSPESRKDVRYAIEKTVLKPDGFDAWSDEEKHDWTVAEVNRVMEKLNDRIEGICAGVNAMNKANCDKKCKVCKCKVKRNVKRCAVVLPAIVVGCLIVRGLAK